MSAPFLVRRRLGQAQVLTDATLDKALSASRAVIYFGSPSCPYCVAYKPIFEEVAKEQAGRILMASLDANEASASASKYKVEGIPATIFLLNGQEVGRVEGKLSKEDLQAQISKVFGASAAPAAGPPIGLVLGGLALVAGGIYLLTKE